MFYLLLNKTIQNDIKTFGSAIAECVSKCIHPNAVQSIAGRGVGIQSAFPATTGSHQNVQRPAIRPYVITQHGPRHIINQIEPQQAL